MSATRLASEIASRNISATEALQAYLDRIQATHAQLNAVTQVLREQVLANAAGSLAGVPFSVKDSIDVAGVRTTSGTLGRRNSPPATRDAAVVSRARALGATPIAKTNLPDLLYSFETDNLIFGRTNNPYDLTRTPGGSSGGEAALIAACGSAFGFGSDAFGSVRLPAAFCGLAAIKPTSGRIPRTGHMPGPGGWIERVWQIGPMARRVEDLLTLYPTLAQADNEDLWASEIPLSDNGPQIGESLRVAYFTDNGYAQCQPYIKAAVEKCARFLASQHARVAEIRPPGLEDVFDLEMALFGADGGDGLDDYLRAIGSHQVHPLQTNFVDYMRPHRATLDQFAKRWEQWDQYRTGLMQFFTNYDVVLCPVYTQVALQHGESMQPDKFRGFSYTMAWNVGQAPAATVRCAEHEGLPVNVQVVAKPWNDLLALRICKAIEEEFGGWQPPPL